MPAPLGNLLFAHFPSTLPKGWWTWAPNVGRFSSLSHPCISTFTSSPNTQVVSSVDFTHRFLGVFQQDRLSERVCFRHAAAEATGLASFSADVVAVSLVFHELPQSAARAVIREAFRILRRGGCLAINVSALLSHMNVCFWTSSSELHSSNIHERLYHASSLPFA